MKIYKRIFALFLIVVLLSSSIPVSAHDAYFLSVTIDPDSSQYVGTINKEEVDMVNSNHAEWKNGAVFATTKDQAWLNVCNTGFNHYWNKLGSDESTMKTFYKDDVGIKDDFDLGITTGYYSMAFTFPGLHEDAIEGISQNEANANQTDKDLAERVLNYPIEGLNDCLSFIILKCYGGRAQSPKVLQTIGSRVAAASISVENGNSMTIQVNNKDVLFTRASTNYNYEKGAINKSDYVTVTINGEARDFCYRCPKGYVAISGRTIDGKTGKTESLKDANYISKLEKGEDPKFINWNLIVAQGNYNSDVSGLAFTNLDTIVNPGIFTSLVGGIFGALADSIRWALRLKSMDDYMLIQNKVQTDWVYGLFPVKFLPSALLIYAICLMIAMSLIGFSILRLLWKKQLSTVNIGEKIAMQDGIKNLIITLFLMVAFVPIFVFLAGLNASIVNMMASAIDFSNFLGGNVWNVVNLGSIVLAIAQLIIDIYFNFFYVVRAITIVVLFGVAPIMIYSLSLGGKIASVFSTWLKELISNIFVQSVHSIIAVIFFNLGTNGALTTFERLVIMYSFIPITNFVKTKVFQLTDGPAGAVAGAGTAATAGIVSGTASGFFGKDKQSGNRSGSNTNGAANTSTTTSDAGSSIGRAYQKARENNNISMQDVYDGKNINGNYSFNDKLNHVGKYIGSPLQHGLSAMADIGMGVGMTAIGQNGSKYFEGAGKHIGQAKSGLGHTAEDIVKHNRQKQAAINDLEYAGITNVQQNGRYSHYTFDANTSSSMQNNAIFEDMKKAWSDSSEYTPEQRKAARDYYRDNYGVHSFEPTGDGKKAEIVFDTAKLNATRADLNNPFGNMKTYTRWDSGKKPDGGSAS